MASKKRTDVVNELATELNPMKRGRDDERECRQDP